MATMDGLKSKGMDNAQNVSPSDRFLPVLWVFILC